MPYQVTSVFGLVTADHRPVACVWHWFEVQDSPLQQSASLVQVPPEIEHSQESSMQLPEQQSPSEVHSPANGRQHVWELLEQVMSLQQGWLAQLSPTSTQLGLQTSLMQAPVQQVSLVVQPSPF
jgi:hypothetical protein